MLVLEGRIIGLVVYSKVGGVLQLTAIRAVQVYMLKASTR